VCMQRVDGDTRKPQLASVSSGINTSIELTKF
jgi:hypothetical protein